MNGHGGEMAMATLHAYGVNEIFTLSGGHIFPFYDACVKQGLAIYDVRHEQTATFAAEGMAKLTRRPGVAVLTAGPGVTNGVSAMTTASFNGSPLVVLGGRAPQGRWGSGSLQELDHVPIVGPIMKSAATVAATEDIPKLVGAAATTALMPHRGPVFVDFPLDVVFGAGDADVPEATVPRGESPDPSLISTAASLIQQASRPCLVAGSDVYWDGASDALQRCVETLRVPCFTNGLGRGCLPADHELSFSRVRAALKEADVVVVVGTPLDFRLSFGRFGSARVVHIVDSVDNRAGHVSDVVSPAGDLTEALNGLVSASGGRGSRSHEEWISTLREREIAARSSESDMLSSASSPIHPGRVYGELRSRLARDAVVIGDGGDFVSFAGRLVDSYQPGCWMDPGPYGCLGTGLGYAMAARVARPDSQVVLMLGDGAAGFSLMDVDSLVRHGLPVVIVVGNNGIWGLEKHPMRMLYGYDVAADLQPACRYDEVVRALGGAGELVERAEDVGPALDRAFAAGVPYLVNVVLDPDVMYPRSSNLG
jgi:acetolactate synthase-1/2/3 large subunit